MKLTKYKTNKIPYKKRYHGFALPLVLITFVVVALISAISVKVSLMDESLGRNQTDRNTSRKMAELALMDAKDDILCNKTINGVTKSDGRIFYNDDPLYVNDDTCSDGLCGLITDDTNPKYWDTLHLSNTTIDFAKYADFSGRTKIKTASDTVLFDSIIEPRYIIEAIQTKLAIGDAGNKEWQYRITAVGYGKYNANIFTKIQEVYRAYEGVSKCSYGDNASYTRNFSPNKTYNQ